MKTTITIDIKTPDNYRLHKKVVDCLFNHIKILNEKVGVDLKVYQESEEDGWCRYCGSGAEESGKTICPRCERIKNDIKEENDG